MGLNVGAGRAASPADRSLVDPMGPAWVVALDASPSTPRSLREHREDDAIENIDTVEGRWPPSDLRARARTRHTSG